jgi:hypothetical protein
MPSLLGWEKMYSPFGKRLNQWIASYALPPCPSFHDLGSSDKWFVFFLL